VSRTVVSQEVTDPDGRFRILVEGEGPARLTAELKTPDFRIVNVAGKPLTSEARVSGEAQIAVDFNATEEFELAQLTALYWAQLAHNAARPLIDNLPHEPLTIRVNLDEKAGDTYYSPADHSIGLPRSHLRDNKRIPNAAIPEIIVHEYAHSLDVLCGGVTNAGVAEGIAYAWGAIVTRQPLYGRGWDAPGGALWDLREIRRYKLSRDWFEVGRSFAGFVWDLTQRFVEEERLDRGFEQAEDRGFEQARRLVLGMIAMNPADVPEAVRFICFIDAQNGSPHAQMILAAARTRALPVPEEPLRLDTAPRQPYPPRGAPTPLVKFNSGDR
jgi:hypothetical protein